VNVSYLSRRVLGERAKLILEQATPNLRRRGAPLFGETFDFLERVVFDTRGESALRRTVVALIHWSSLRSLPRSPKSSLAATHSEICASLRQAAGALTHANHRNQSRQLAGAAGP